MLFTKFLLALPLFATASLSAPTGETVAVVERASSSPVDVLSVVSNFQTDVVSVVPSFPLAYPAPRKRSSSRVRLTPPRTAWAVLPRPPT
jgi:hypothetical protein